MKLDQIVKQRFEDLAASYKGILDGNGGANSSKFYAWSTSVLSLLGNVFGEESIQYKNFNSQFVRYGNERGSTVIRCKGVFDSAKEDYEKGYLFTVRGLIKAEDSTDVLEEALDFLNAGYKDPACILAGVALEIAIKEICTRNSIALAKLEAMNTELCKKGVYNMGMQKQVTAWAHWRNKAAHGEWSEYKEVDVKSMIEGVQRFVADYL